MKKAAVIVLTILTIFGLSQCGVIGTSNGSGTTDSTIANSAIELSEDNTLITGADRDMHDCIASAGYTWSVVLGKCIRIFEDGVKLTSPETPGYAAYIVFATDSSRVELYCPGANGKVNILDRHTLPDGSSVWNVDETQNLRKVEGEWIVSQGGKVIYYSE